MVKKKVILIAFFTVLFIIACFSCTRYLKSYISKPLTGHDVLVYGTEGTIYYNEKSLNSKYSGYYPKTGFSRFSYHAPGFPLLITWEKILNRFIQRNSDYFFKSISPYYGFLIILNVFLLLRKKNLILAIFGVYALFSGFNFFKNFTTYHIDMYRIYFLLSSWIILAYTVEKKDKLAIFMLGVFSGFAAFSHIIGAIISVINLLAFFLFLDSGFWKRIKYSLYVCFLIIFIGGFHYFFDAFWGREGLLWIRLGLKG